MVSKVDIVNIALIRVGQKVITNLDDVNSHTARTCKSIFDSGLNTVLAGRFWSFAGKTVQLSELADEATPGWTYSYLQPTDCLFINKIFNSDTMILAGSQDYRETLSFVTGQKSISANITPAYLEGTFSITDIDLCTPDFIDAFAYKLGSDLAQSLAGNVELSGFLFKQYQISIAQTTIKEDKPTFQDIQHEPSSSFIDAR